MKHLLKTLCISSALVCSSCSTTKDSITLGVITGSVAGAVGGKTLSHTQRDKKAKVAAASGAILGGIVSYFIHKGLEKRDAKVRKETLFNLENFGVTNPSFEQPESSNYFFPQSDYLKRAKRGRHK